MSKEDICETCGHKRKHHSKVMCYYANEYHEQCTCKEFKLKVAKRGL